MKTANRMIPQVAARGYGAGGREMEETMEIGAPEFLVRGRTHCPFGLMKELQTIQAILLRLDLPRGQIPIQLYLNILRGRALGGPLERKIKVTELVKDVFGEMYGELVHIGYHFTNNCRLGEDARTRLKCDADCEACQLRIDAGLLEEIDRLRRALSKNGCWD